MSRLKIDTPNKAQMTVERLYKDLERRIVAFVSRQALKSQGPPAAAYRAWGE